MVLDRGDHEGEKATVHALLGAMAGICALYNVCAFCRRGERHLAINAVIYGAVTALEITQIRRHLETDPGPDRRLS